MNASRALRHAVLAALLPALPASAASLAAQLETAARAQLARQFDAAGLADPQFQLEVATVRAAPPCAQPLEIAALDTRQPARMRFAVSCPAAGGWRYEYVVRAQVTALVAVAALPLASGATLDEAAVALERRDVTLVPDAFGSAAAVVGQASRRALRAGEVLRAAQLAPPLLVRRGEQVTMVARREQVEVSTSGEALDSGARGAPVRVRNNASGQVLRMRVTGAGTVEPWEAAAIIR